MSRNSSTPLGSVPKEVQEHVRNLLSITTTLRPDIHMMSKVQKQKCKLCSDNTLYALQHQNDSTTIILQSYAKLPFHSQGQVIVCDMWSSSSKELGFFLLFRGPFAYLLDVKNFFPMSQGRTLPKNCASFSFFVHIRHIPLRQCTPWICCSHKGTCCRDISLQHIPFMCILLFSLL